MKQTGRSNAYIQGFHDDRHSGMTEEGNAFEHFIKDHEQFSNNEGYRNGWLAGELEGKKLQQQAMNVGNALGNALVNAYSDSQITKEEKKHQNADKAAKDALKGVDVSTLKTLKKDN